MGGLLAAGPVWWGGYRCGLVARGVWGGVALGCSCGINPGGCMEQHQPRVQFQGTPGVHAEASPQDDLLSPQEPEREKSSLKGDYVEKVR